MSTEILTLNRLVALPATPVANSVYFTKGADSDLLEITMVSTDGTEVRHVIAKAEIAALIDTKISDNNNAQNAAVAVADIPARDALILTASRFVMVTDASADATVTSGAAMYFYDQPADAWTKIYEAEGMELVLNWANLADKPASAVAAIDQAVADSHTHSNKTVIDKFSEVSGELKYDGDFLKTYVNADW